MRENESPDVNQQVIRTHCTLDDIDMGARAIAQFPASQDRFLTSFTGIEPDRFVQVALPSSTGKRERLRKDMMLTVRYLHRGQVRGFETTILATILQPFPLLFLEYPEQIEMLELRRHPRVNCFLPVMIYRGDHMAIAVMLNLSHSGCRLFLEPKNNTLGSLSAGDDVLIKARLYESYGDMYLQGVIKNIPPDSPSLSLGVVFQRHDKKMSAAVNYHLDRMRELR